MRGFLIPIVAVFYKKLTKPRNRGNEAGSRIALRAATLVRASSGLWRTRRP
jgi:hypothetical protein